MRRPDQTPSAADIEGLLAAEREILAESQDLRNRVLRRANASLQHYTAVPLDLLSPSFHRLKFGLIAAAAITLTAMCAVAFVAGYRTSNGGTAALAPPAVTLQSRESQGIPAAPLVVASIPPAASSLHTTAEPASRGPRIAPTRPRTDSEALAAELRVLQAARQSVARRDFSSALANLAEHQRSYPSGALSEEREALRIKALVGLGRRAEAARAGAAFRKHFPRSALNGRIEEMLGHKP